jgi:hypothetical protein
MKLLDKNKPSPFYYCQRHIEGHKKCKKQCDHCYDYYKPLQDHKIIEMTPLEIKQAEYIEYLKGDILFLNGNDENWFDANDHIQFENEIKALKDQEEKPKLSAEEIIERKAIENKIFYTSNEYHTILEAMHEYHAQFSQGKENPLSEYLKNGFTIEGKTFYSSESILKAFENFKNQK